MEKLNRSHNSQSDAVASYKLSRQNYLCAVSSVKSKIPALKGNQTDAGETASSSQSPKLGCARRFMTTITQNVRPPSLRVQSMKHAETQRDTSSEPHSKDVEMKSASRGDTNISIKTRFSSASTMLLWNNPGKQEATTPLDPETQKPSLAFFPKPHQDTRLPTPPTSLTATKSKYKIRHGTQNKLQKESSDHPHRDVLTLQVPPTKPNRPPSVDIQRFRQTSKHAVMMMPCPAAPPPLPPPLPLRTMSIAASSLPQLMSKQLDMESAHDKSGIMGPPLQHFEGDLSKGVEVKTSVDFNGRKPDLSLNRRETYNPKGQWPTRNAEYNVCVNAESVTTGYEELKGKQELGFPFNADIYYTVEVSADSGANMQKADGECHIYDDVDSAETRIVPLVLPATDEDTYDDVGAQNPLLPFDEPDIHGDMGEDCVYELD